jgi:hypothetical protein
MWLKQNAPCDVRLDNYQPWIVTVKMNLELLLSQFTVVRVRRAGCVCEEEAFRSRDGAVDLVRVD